MIPRSEIEAALPGVLSESHLDFLGERYEGKVRDNYTRDGVRFILTTDRLSCFDKVMTTVPFKGQALNEMAIYWFEKSDHIIQNHIVDTPDPNVLVVKNCEVVPIEVVVRGYLAGSAWRDYVAGRPVSGVKFPPGLKASAKLERPVLTPSTKAERGVHDEPISEEEILARKIVSPALWQQIHETALALFGLGTELALRRGLLLVDTKYEFGLLNGKLILVDEIHTMDCSRYWVAESYGARYESGESPEMLDKEPTRQWLVSQGYKGEGAVPEFTSQHRCEIAEHYIKSYQRITGQTLVAHSGSVIERIEKRLRDYSISRTAARRRGQQ